MARLRLPRRWMVRLLARPRMARLRKARLQKTRLWMDRLRMDRLQMTRLLVRLRPPQLLRLHALLCDLAT